MASDTPNRRVDEEMIRKTLSLLYQPGDVVELRMPNTKKGTISGYFNDPQSLSNIAKQASGKVPTIYVTLNPVIPDLLARAKNRVKPYTKAATSDTDIVKRCWFGVDVDFERPKGISSTDEEHRLALDRAEKIRAFLRDQGFPDPIYADSGNGGHLLYKIDLPNDSDSRELIEQCLKALDYQFCGDKVKVDTSVYNAARMWKLYGTMSCKGDNLPERPHRLAKILEIPEHIEVASREKLEQLASMLPKPQETNGSGRSYAHLDLESWLQEHGLTIKEIKPWNKARIYELAECPFNPEHDRGEASVIQFQNGALCFKCFHNSCQGYDWHVLRDKLEPGWRERREGNGWDHQTSRPDRFNPENKEQDYISFNLTDLGNAQRLATKHGEDIKYCHQNNQWYAWNGIHWQKDESGEIERRAKDTVRGIYNEAAATSDESRRKALSTHALRSESRSRIESMIKLACSEERIPVLIDDFDKDPWLLNVRNGTLNLKTGELKPHDRSDLISRVIPIEYNPSSEYSLWMEFLNRIFKKDEELIKFIQRAIGYCLTGDVSEHKLFFCWGTGNNGKSVFLNTIRDLFGPYGKEIDPNLLMVTFGDQHPVNRADLKGLRLGTTIETQEGRRLNEVLVKWLTGGDRIKARFLYQNFFEFDPTHKFWIAGNYKPVIRGTDLAIWRRIDLIPFTVTIPKEERDPHLKEKLKRESEGILAWAVEGCLLWQEKGLNEPKAVVKATKAYKDEMDVLTHFINEMCFVDDGAKTLVADLHREYVNWCSEAGEKPLGKMHFNDKMRDKGFEDGRGTQNKPHWFGIGLLAKKHSEGCDCRECIGG